MVFFYSAHTDIQIGPHVRIDCSRCGEIEVTARSYEQTETLKAYHVLPVLKLTNTFVVCESCGAEYISRLARRDLEDYRETNVTALVFLYISFAVRFLAIISLALCVLPLIGFVLALITVLSTRKVRGWPRILGLAALAVSSVVTILAIVGMMLGF